jgi:hypothetical protein
VYKRCSGGEWFAWLVLRCRRGLVAVGDSVGWKSVVGLKAQSRRIGQGLYRERAIETRERQADRKELKMERKAWDDKETNAGGLVGVVACTIKCIL